MGARKALWNVSAFFLLDFSVEVQLLQCLRVYFQAIFIAFMLLDKIEFGLSHSNVACVSFSLHFFFFLSYFLYIYILQICIVICSLINCSLKQQNHAYLLTILLIDLRLLCFILPLCIYLKILFYS